jgi:hypothetical protein
MDAKHAKDFLVQQAVEQAAVDGVSLSDLERRMMYFTESDASCEDPTELNEQFETQYDTAKYETKVSHLLHHAYEQSKVEGPERMREWNLAIRTLRRGDHYLLVLWDLEPPSDHPLRDFLKPVGIGMLIALGIVVAMMFAAKYRINLDRVLPGTHPGLGISMFVGLLVLLALAWTRVSNWLLLRRPERRAKRGKGPR